MAITFDAATGNKVASGTTNTWSHTVASSQSNQILVVSVDSGASISGITYNSVAMTQLTSITYGGSEILSLWYLVAPAQGAHNVVITASGTTFIVGVSASYYNVAQTSMFGTAVTNSGTGTASTNTVTTSNTNQWVIDTVNNAAASTDTATASQNKRFQPATSGAAEGDIVATGSNMTLTWSFTSGNWAQISVAMFIATTNFTTTITDTQLTSFSAEASTVQTNVITERLTSFTAEASASQTNVITEQLTTFSANATVTKSLASVPTGIHVFISGVEVMIYEGSFEIDDSVNAVSTCTFTIRDDSGTNHYTKRQQVLVIDSVKGLVYSGYINSVEEDRESPNTLIKSAVAIRDNHDLAEKRTYPGPDFTNAYAGTIATSLLDILAVEGVTAQYANRRETTQGQFALGTLTGVTSATNVGDGNLELSPAGTPVTIIESTTSDFSSGTLTTCTAANNTLTATPTNTIKLTGQMNVAGISNPAVYYKIYSGSYTLQSRDFLHYSVWIDDASPEKKAAVDIIFTDGTSLRDVTNFGYVDDNDILPAANADLGGLASGRWYTRLMNISGNIKTVAYVSVALAGTQTGVYTAYFKNIEIRNYPLDRWLNPNQSTTLRITIFNGTLQTPAQQLQSIGYENCALTIVPTYDLPVYPAVGNGQGDANSILTSYPSPLNMPYRVSSAYSISAGGILRASLINWSATEPGNTAADTQKTKAVVKYQLDNGALVECTNGQSLPGLVPGMNLSSRTLTLYEEFYALQGASPEVAPSFNSVVVAVQPSYACTKSDVAYTTVWSAGEAGTTFSSTVALQNALTLIGATRNWDFLQVAGQTSFLGSAGDTLFNQSYQFGNPSAGNESKTRFDFAGTYTNCTIECDVNIQSDIQIGVVYRSTNFSTNNGSYAYVAWVSASAITLKRGTNTTGGGAGTTISTVGITLTGGSWHKLKVIVNGSSHQVFLDDVRFINSTDATFSGSGSVGVFGVSPTQAYPQFNFDNFGVMPLLTGTWLSPAVSLTAASTYGNSFIAWRDRSESPASNDSILVEMTINGGSTWTACANGTALPVFNVGSNLSGVSLQIRITLTTTTASKMPAIDTLWWLITGGFSSSGTRTSLALPMTGVGRLGSSVVAWNATLPTGTTLGVDVAFDGGSWVDVTSGNGQPFPVFTGQVAPAIDTFASNTSANYTNTNRSGGSVATVTYNTANSRLTLTGGSKALYIANSPTNTGDVELLFDMDESDSGGLVWHYQDTDNFYELVVADASASVNPNTISLFRISSGTRTQLGATTAISFARGTYHRFKVHYEINIHLATCYIDGLQVLQVTAILPATGKSGLRNDGGTSRYYSLQIQPLSADVSSDYVQTRLRLASTDPTVTPQISDHTIAAYGTTIQPGALIPQTDYIFKYINECFDDLIKQSSASGGQWWWNIDKYLVASMLPNAGIPAPWLGSSVLNPDGTADFLDAGLKVIDESDLYRNRQIITNVMDTASINETRAGDGISRTWTFKYNWASAPAITVNGVIATVGVKGVDTGKMFYYAVDDPIIAVDDSIATYTAAYAIKFVGTGQFLTYSQYDNLTEQAAVALKDNTSGIVENVEDGTGLTKAAGDALAQARVKQYGVRGKKLEATTLREGLAPGMLLPAFIPEHDLFDTLMLIRNIKTRLTPDGATGLHKFWYTIEAISGADIGDWTEMYRKR